MDRLSLVIKLKEDFESIGRLLKKEPRKDFQLLYEHLKKEIEIQLCYMEHEQLEYTLKG